MKTDFPRQKHGSSPVTASLSREEEARAHLGQPVLNRLARRVLFAGFCVVLGAGLAAEFVLYAPSPGNRWKAWIALWPSHAQWAAVRSPADLWALLPQPQATRAAEKALEESSALAQHVRPHVQRALTALFEEGNSQVRVAPHGRGLFFSKDCESVEGPGFAELAWQARRRAAGVEADSAAAILDFHRQLADRGITLVVLPVPVKPMVEGHWLAREYRVSKSGVHVPIQTTAQNAIRVRANRSYNAWIENLRAAGVDVLDVAGALVEREKQTGLPQYLRADTHWRPEAMEAVAARLAEHIRTRLPANEDASGDKPARAPAQTVSAPGDTLALLGLPADQSVFVPEHVAIHPVTRGGHRWKTDPQADVLVLGDSFTNIYSLGAMGWGEGAGFAEQLSAELGRAVDVLARNSDGAYATRGMLQRELAAGRDRLQAKRVVVWEFASRELSFGDWRLIPLKMGAQRPAFFYAPAQGQRVRIRGVVGDISAIPEPGSVPYREHIVSLRLVDVIVPEGGIEPGRQALVYGWSMRERQGTELARVRPGDFVEMELRPWEEVAAEFEKFQRSEFADPLLAVEPVSWVDWIQQAPLPH